MKIPVSLLGATGTVGQKLIALLAQHPQFTIGELVASENSIGKSYHEACSWREKLPCPAELSQKKISHWEEISSPYAVSCLPKEQALSLEKLLVERGIHVISNAAAYRMQKNVPLLIPEINRQHLSLLKQQTTPGKLITNPNCAVVVAALALAPLQDLAKIESVSVVTLQAISGAGYPGVAALDILGNIIPYIPDEEEKITQEIPKILGSAEHWAPFSVMAHVHRVPVQHGHCVILHIRFAESVTAQQARDVYFAWNKKYKQLYEIYSSPNRPQPLLDLTDNDQRCHIGRLKQGPDNNTLGLFAMGHNLVRGAAGAALLNLQTFLDYSREQGLA